MEYADDTDSNYLFKQYYTMEVEGYNVGDQIASVWKTDEENQVDLNPVVRHL